VVSLSVVTELAPVSGLVASAPEKPTRLQGYWDLQGLTYLIALSSIPESDHQEAMPLEGVNSQMTPKREDYPGLPSQSSKLADVRDFVVERQPNSCVLVG
jgi:hypothetical protein